MKGVCKMEKYLLGILRLLLTVMSPELRKNLEDFVKQLEVNAAKTVNEWDDVFVAILKTLLQIK